MIERRDVKHAHSQPAAFLDKTLDASIHDVPGISEQLDGSFRRGLGDLHGIRRLYCACGSNKFHRHKDVIIAFACPLNFSKQSGVRNTEERVTTQAWERWRPSNATRISSLKNCFG